MTDTAITIVPANEASWEDLQAVLCTRGDASRCQCQRYKMQPGVRSHALPSSSRVTGGAGALEGYPMITQPGQEVARGELHVGSRSVFGAAGFEEVSHPTRWRVVMRIDF